MGAAEGDVRYSRECRSGYTDDLVPLEAAAAPQGSGERFGKDRQSVTVRNRKIVELDFFADPERLRQLDLTILDD